MMDGHRSRPAGEGDDPVAREQGVSGIDSARKDAAVKVAEDRPLVRAGDHHERFAARIDVLQDHADGQEVVVSVRIERPVLVPLDRGSATGSLNVELAGLQPDHLPYRACSTGLTFGAWSTSPKPGTLRCGDLIRVSRGLAAEWPSSRS